MKFRGPGSVSWNTVRYRTNRRAHVSDITKVGRLTLGMIVIIVVWYGVRTGRPL